MFLVTANQYDHGRHGGDRHLTQVTKYLYGTTLANSEIASSRLLREVIYPDSTSGTDRVKHRYNRQGEVIETTDQNQTEHAFDYDLLGRRTQDRVVTLGSGVDGAVRRIETAFNKRGNIERITSFDSATAGSGNVVNEVFVLYNGFGQAIDTFQSHAGEVNLCTTPSVERWRNTDTGSDLSRVLYGYDRASSRIWRENPSDSSRRYDWLYGYDGLHRLHSAERGELNSGHTSITSPQFGQCWTLDPTGNWHGFRQDDDGNTTWDLIQARTKWLIEQDLGSWGPEFRGAPKQWLDTRVDGRPQGIDFEFTCCWWLVGRY